MPKSSTRKAEQTTRTKHHDNQRTTQHAINSSTNTNACTCSIRQSLSRTNIRIKPTPTQTHPNPCQYRSYNHSDNTDHATCLANVKHAMRTTQGSNTGACIETTNNRIRTEGEANQRRIHQRQHHTTPTDNQTHAAIGAQPPSQQTPRDAPLENPTH